MNLSLSNAVVKIALAVICTASAISVHGQSTAFGIRFTPSHVPGATVQDDSPANIYGPPGLNLNVGIYALKYFKNQKVGIKAGIEQGAVRFMVGVDAPRNAFGTGDGGDAQIVIAFGIEPFSYKALTITPVYKLPFKGSFLEFSIGPSIRRYSGYWDDGFNEILLAFNRAVLWDPDEPNAGPPDVRARVTHMSRFYLSFPASVDYLMRVSKHSQVKFGVMHNISAPLHGELDVQMYGKFFYGTFRPRTGFWGANITYEYLTKRSAASYHKPTAEPISGTGRRQSMYVESYLKKGYVALNYDLRLIRGRQDGIGVSAGIGLGYAYWSKVPVHDGWSSRRTLAIPVGINYIIGNHNHGAEIGLGITPQLYTSERRFDKYRGTMYSARVGYRFQPVSHGVTARVAWVPTAEKIPVFGTTEKRVRNFGVSLGYSFK